MYASRNVDTRLFLLTSESERYADRRRRSLYDSILLDQGVHGYGCASRNINTRSPSKMS